MEMYPVSIEHQSITLHAPHYTPLFENPKLTSPGHRQCRPDPEGYRGNDLYNSGASVHRQGKHGPTNTQIMHYNYICKIYQIL